MGLCACRHELQAQQLAMHAKLLASIPTRSASPTHPPAHSRTAPHHNLQAATRLLSCARRTWPRTPCCWTRPSSQAGP
jgi:hypothetical protein